MTTNFFSNTHTFKELYDPVQKHLKTKPYIIKIYGEDIYKQLTKEIIDARTFRKTEPDDAFSKGLVKTMREICLKKFPGCGYEVEKDLDDRALKDYQSNIGFYIKQKPEKEVEVDNNLEANEIQRKRQKGDDFFIMLERGVFRNPEFRKIFKGPFSVYGWLWSNIVREGWIDKPGYPIKEKYYDKGLLAYCSSYSKIGKECFMSKDTVKKYIDRFKEYGIIKVYYILPEGKKLEQCVYVLGEWMEFDGNIHEKLYLAHELLSVKKGSVWDFDMGDES